MCRRRILLAGHRSLLLIWWAFLGCCTSSASWSILTYKNGVRLDLEDTYHHLSLTRRSPSRHSYLLSSASWWLHSWARWGSTQVSYSSPSAVRTFSQVSTDVRYFSVVSFHWFPDQLLRGNVHLTQYQTLSKVLHCYSKAKITLCSPPLPQLLLLTKKQKTFE